MADSAPSWLVLCTWQTCSDHPGDPRLQLTLPHLLEPDLTFLALLGEEGIGQELGMRAEFLGWYHVFGRFQPQILQIPLTVATGGPRRKILILYSVYVFSKACQRYLFVWP